MTDNYNNDNAHHREIRLGIEYDVGMSNIKNVSKAAGFTLEMHEDLADRAHASRSTVFWTEA